MSRSSHRSNSSNYSSNSSNYSSKSSNYSSKSSTTAPPCAHCRNLGLPTDHALRTSADPNSAVLCKVLLATECKYCYKFGHTISHCAAKKKAAMAPKSETRPPQSLPKQLSTASSASNPFACFQEDTDDEDKEPVKQKRNSQKRKLEVAVADDFPVLSSMNTSMGNHHVAEKMSFAAIVAKQPELKKMDKVPPPSLILLRYQRNWADIEDDE